MTLDQVVFESVVLKNCLLRSKIQSIQLLLCCSYQEVSYLQLQISSIGIYL